MRHRRRMLGAVDPAADNTLYLPWEAPMASVVAYSSQRLAGANMLDGMVEGQACIVKDDPNWLSNAKVYKTAELDIVSAYQELWNENRSAIALLFPDWAGHEIFVVGLVVDGWYGEKTALSLAVIESWFTTPEGNIPVKACLMRSYLAAKAGVPQMKLRDPVERLPPPCHEPLVPGVDGECFCPDGGFPVTGGPSLCPPGRGIVTCPPGTVPDPAYPGDCMRVPEGCPAGTVRHAEGHCYTPQTDYEFQNQKVSSAAGRSQSGWIYWIIGGAAVLGGGAYAVSRYKKRGRK